MNVNYWIDLAKALQFVADECACNARGDEERLNNIRAAYRRCANIIEADDATDQQKKIAALVVIACSALAQRWVWVTDGS